LELCGDARGRLREDKLMSSSIEEIKKTGKFTWGQPIKWHEIGPYTLLEYYPWESDGCLVKPGTPSKEISFHGWLDGENVNSSWPSLECGLAGLMGRKYASHIREIGCLFCKMIDAPPYEKKR